MSKDKKNFLQEVKEVKDQVRSWESAIDKVVIELQNQQREANIDDLKEHMELCSDRLQEISKEMQEFNA